MKRRGTFYALVAVLGLALGFGQQAADAQKSAPKENKRMTAAPKQAVDLGPEIEGMKDRQLRMRVLTIEPGGHIGLHSHKDRPAVAYFLQGTDTMALEDGTEKTLRPGDTSFGNKDTVHWHRNDGKEPVVFIVVDIFHDKK